MQTHLCRSLFWMPSMFYPSISYTFNIPIALFLGSPYRFRATHSLSFKPSWWASFWLYLSQEYTMFWYVHYKICHYLECTRAYIKFGSTLPISRPFSKLGSALSIKEVSNLFCFISTILFTISSLEACNKCNLEK